jgi:hypothetical protein
MTSHHQFNGFEGTLRPEEVYVDRRPPEQLLAEAYRLLAELHASPPDEVPLQERLELVLVAAEAAIAGRPATPGDDLLDTLAMLGEFRQIRAQARYSLAPRQHVLRARAGLRRTFTQLPDIDAWQFHDKVDAARRRAQVDGNSIAVDQLHALEGEYRNMSLGAHFAALDRSLGHLEKLLQTPGDDVEAWSAHMKAAIANAEDVIASLHHHLRDESERDENVRRLHDSERELRDLMDRIPNAEPIA